MKRRIATAVIGSVVVALLLAGLGTLVLTRSAARRTALDELQAQSAAIAELVAAVATPRRLDDGTTEPQVNRQALQRISQAFSVRDVGLVVITANGREVGSLPPGVELSANEDAVVRGGGEVSGTAPGGVLYGAAGRQVGRSIVIVALTGSARSLLGGAGGWFLLASALVVLVAVFVAFRLGGALARPMREATAVTERIAGGDLTARLPDPPPAQHDELAVLSRSVNSMADNLERSRGLEQQFLLSISHDLRTPLTNIRGYAEAIADGAADEPAAAAGVILSESARLERLVRDLLDLARLDSRQFTLHPAGADLTAAVVAAAEGARADVAAMGLTLDVRPGTTADGTVDVDRLAQVVGNLVANAARYARTTVIVEPQVHPDSVVVLVTDDGAGIAPADLPHVFERLYRAADQPQRKESGSGLGLAIVRELVGAMGGEVGVTSPPTGGTTFWFRIPREGPAGSPTVSP
jgi:signal transduction histidine kinase